MEWTNAQRIAAALERIADVVDPPPMDEDTWLQRSIWEEFAGVVMAELPRIGYALSVLADTDPKTLLERAAAQAEAPDMSEALEAEYQRGRAEERADAVRFLQRERNAQAEPYGGEALSDAVAWIERGDHLGGAQ